MYDIILTNLTSALLAITTICVVNKYFYILIYEDDKVIYQLVYLLDLYLSSETDNTLFENEIIKIKLFHDLECSKKYKLESCNVCSLDEIKISHLTNDIGKLKLLSALFYFIENTLIKSFTREEFELFNFMNLIYNYSLTTIDETIPHFRTVYKTKELLNRYRKRRNSYYYNLVLYFGKINKHSDNTLKKFKIIQRLDTSVSSLHKSISIINDVIYSINLKIRKDLYPLTKELNEHKNIIMDSLTQINLQKNVYIDNFTFLICKYVFEKIFNIDLNSTIKSLVDSDDFELKLDFIEDKWKNDSIIVIRYNVKKNSLIITRASKFFVDYQGKNFEEIFLKELKEDGKQKFIELIHSNNDTFSFEFITETSCGYIRNIKIDCKIFRSFDLQDLFIMSTFEVGIEDLIVFETTSYLDSASVNLKLYDLDNNTLIAFSEALEKVLFLTPNIIKFIHKSKMAKKVISFNDIFQKSSGGVFDNKPSSVMILNPYNYEYIINYQQYFKNLFQKILEMYSVIEEEDINDKIAEIKHLVLANIVLNIKINLKYTIKRLENVDFCVYSVKVIYKRHNSLLNTKQSSYNNNRKDAFNNEDRDNLEDFLNRHQDKALLQSSGTVSSSASIFMKGGNPLMPFMMNKKRMSLNSESNMNRFTIITLVGNIFLSFYCIIFLILGFISSNTLSELNTLKINFNQFERMFFYTTMNIFHNVVISPTNSNSFDVQYWEKRLQSYGYTIDMGHYVNKEFSVKCDLLKQYLNNLQNFIYTSSFSNDLDKIFNFNTENIFITLNDGKISSNTVVKTFFDSMLIFMNNGKSTNVTDSSEYTHINIFNFNIRTLEADFTSIYNKDLTSAQKTLMEVTMNYPSYLNNMNKIWREINLLFENEIYKLSILNNWLTIVFIVLHVFLCFISMAILNFLKKSIADSNYVISKLSNGDWTKYLFKKMEIMKELILFYKYDLIKSSLRLKHDIKENMIKMRQNKSKRRRTNNYGEDDDEEQEELQSKYVRCESKINFENLVSPLIKILYYLFTLYLIYAFAFLILFNVNYSEIGVTSDYVNVYFETEKSIANTLILLQTLLVTNQTAFSLSEYLSTNTNLDYDIKANPGYVLLLTEYTKELVNLQTIYQTEHSKFRSVGVMQDSLTECDSLYDKINDEVFNITENYFAKDELKNNLKLLCNSFNIMNHTEFDKTQYFIEYSLMKIARLYNYSPGIYDDMMNLLNDFQFFDDYTIVTMIQRPISNYVFNNVVSTIVTNTEDSFKLTIILYIVGNITTEIMIFIFINRKLIKRVLKINEEIKCMARCITS